MGADEKLIQEILSLDESARERILAELQKEEPEFAQEIRKRIEEEKKESFDELVRKPMDIGLVGIGLIFLAILYVWFGILMPTVPAEFVEFFEAMLVLLFLFFILLGLSLYTYFKYTRKLPRKLDKIIRKL